MAPLAVTALTAVSAMGRGQAATLAALLSRRRGLVPCDFAGVTDGHMGAVAGVESQALPEGLGRFACRNNRLAAMALETDGFADAVAAAVAAYGPARIAVVLGTSTSGIGASEDAYRSRDPASGTLPAGFDFAASQDIASVGAFVRAALGLRGPAWVVSTACTSSARSFIDGARLIAAGVVDAAVVGGADSLCATTLRGFAALDLVSPEPCRPLDAARRGLSIGEAAGFALIERPGGRAGAGASGIVLLGYGASSDGYHMSAPHPAGTGAIAAMRGALARAGMGPEAIDYINFHGTGTRANDAAEDGAVAAVFGVETPCSSTKAWSGHTLGASGVLEAVIAGLVIRHGVMPGCLGVDTVDPAFRSRILLVNVEAPVRHVLSNAFGFGGSNCVLLLGAA